MQSQRLLRLRSRQIHPVHVARSIVAFSVYERERRPNRNLGRVARVEKERETCPLPAAVSRDLMSLANCGAPVPHPIDLLCELNLQRPFIYGLVMSTMKGRST